MDFAPPPGYEEPTRVKQDKSIVRAFRGLLYTSFFLFAISLFHYFAISLFCYFVFLFSPSRPLWRRASWARVCLGHLILALVKSWVVNLWKSLLHQGNMTHVCMLRLWQICMLWIASFRSDLSTACSSLTPSLSSGVDLQAMPIKLPKGKLFFGHRTTTKLPPSSQP